MGAGTSVRNVEGGWLPSRRKEREFSGVIVHATAGTTAKSTIGWLRHLASRPDLADASYHYVIDEDGSIIKLVPLSRVAFHAGKSRGWEGDWCNGYTVGVALANLNDGKDPYTDRQKSALTALLRQLKEAIPELRHVSTHAIVSPGRKTDPIGLNVEALVPKDPRTGKPIMRFWRP